LLGETEERRRGNLKDSLKGSGVFTLAEVHLVHMSLILLHQLVRRSMVILAACKNFLVCLLVLGETKQKPTHSPLYGVGKRGLRRRSRRLSCCRQVRIPMVPFRVTCRHRRLELVVGLD
jgi:hypothetical protein